VTWVDDEARAKDIDSLEGEVNKVMRLLRGREGGADTRAEGVEGPPRET